MANEIGQIIEILESLYDDLPLKAKNELVSVVEALKKLDEEKLDKDKLMAIEDNLEFISNISNIDFYTRNEIINVLSTIESLYNI